MPGSASGYFRRRAAAERGKRLPRAVVVPPMGKKKKRRRAAPVHVTAVVEVSLRHEFAVWRGGGCSGAVPLAPEPSASPRREGTIGPTLHFQLEVRRQTEGSRGRARQHRARSDAGDTLSGRQGGAGKTSLAVETQGLLLDLAPQPSACRWGDRREDAAPVVLDIPPARLKPRSPRPQRGRRHCRSRHPAALGDRGPRDAARGGLVVIPCRRQMVDRETVRRRSSCCSRSAVRRPSRSCSPFRLAASGPIRLAATAAPQRAGVPAHDRASRRLGRCRRPGLTVAEHQPTGRAAAELRPPGPSRVFGTTGAAQWRRSPISRWWLMLLLSGNRPRLRRRALGDASGPLP